MWVKFIKQSDFLYKNGETLFKIIQKNWNKKTYYDKIIYPDREVEYYHKKKPWAYRKTYLNRYGLQNYNL